MPIFFAFSDESGKYKRERTEKFISKNPYYCRSAVLVEAHEWLEFRDTYDDFKKQFLGFNHRQDIKWSYIWSLFKHFQKKERILPEKPYYPLRDIPLDILVEFVRRVLQRLADYRSSCILLTVTFNEKEKTKPLETSEIVKQHLQHVLGTIESVLAKIPDSICVFFLNPEEPRLEKYQKDAFTSIYSQDFPEKYSHIKDSLNFELSPQSLGAQLADYCAGVFNGSLRLYPQSIDLFRHQLWPKIPQKKKHVLGYGITEIPQNKRNKAVLKELLEKIFKAEESDYRVRLEEKLRSKKS